MMKSLAMFALAAYLVGGAALGAGSRHADRELEALLPQTLGGAVLIIESQAGIDLSTNSKAFDTFLAALGKTRADFALASAHAHGNLKAQIGAWRVKGADTTKLLDSFEAAVQASSATALTKAEETLAGRQVARIGDPGQLAQGPLYVIVRDDALLFVQTPDRRLAEEAIGKLTK